MLLTLAAFAFVLGVLIFVHELGHFIAAKAVGIGVPRFSIGFGPATPLRFRRGETEYVIAWFPLGGYVKMASREEQDAMAGVEGGETPEEYPEDQLFENKSLAARILVISAGVAMNFLFAWLIYSAVAAVGWPEDPTTTIGRVVADELPDAAAPLVEVPGGTQILRINGDTVASWRQIFLAIADPTTERLRFDFAGGVDPVILPIRGTDVDDRIAVFASLVPGWAPVVGRVSPGTPAEAAGIEAGDRILRIDSDTVELWADVSALVGPRPGDSLSVLVQRGDAVVSLPIVPQSHSVRGADGEVVEVGQLGIWIADLEPVTVRYGLFGAVVQGARLTWHDTELVLFTLKGIVTGQISSREIGGPVLIGQMSGEFARRGFVALLMFMALLSVNLAIINLLPIPVLDGGHLVFLGIEGVRGKPLSLNARMRLTQFGMVLIMLLVVLVFTNDILRILGG